MGKVEVRREIRQTTKVNLFLQATRTVFAILFPIISFKYVSGVLGVDNLGRISFSTSIVSYFSLLAGLGLASYGIREGTRIRDNRIAFTLFISELFTIGLVSTLISCMLLILLVFSLSALKDYYSLILILASSLPFSAIGVDWVNIVHEDFVFLTIRQILVQVLSFLIILIIVRTHNDIIRYVIIIAASNSIISIFNFIHIRKINPFKLVQISKVSNHLRPILVIFASSIAASIYISSDATMLGLMIGNEAVGLYAGASKVYTAVKTVIASLLIVLLPKATVHADEPNKFTINIIRIVDLLMLITFPAAIGLIVLHERIVVLVSSEAFISGGTALLYLSPALFFSIIASTITTVVFLPLRKERITLYATIASASLNIVANFLLIPIMKHNGAALATMISEALICAISLFGVRGILSIDTKKIKMVWANIFNYLLGCVIIFILACCLSKQIPRTAMGTFSIMAISVIIYVLFLYMRKNEFIVSIMDSITSGLHRVCRRIR